MKQLYSDQELQRLWYEGHQWAFDLLYKRYVIKLLGIAMQKTNNRSLSEELVQDTFMAYYNLAEQKRAHVSAFAFLYVMLKNKIIDHYRHELVKKKFESHFAYTFDNVDHSTTSLIDTRELERLIDHQIGQLPPQCQTVFTLSRKHWLSNKEIASTLQISENTVEQHMRKALKFLRLSVLRHVKILLML